VNDAERNQWNAGNAAVGVRDRRLCVGVPMTAHLHSPVAESARSTVDPDTQARGADGGELSTRYQSDVIPLREPLYRQAMRMTRNHADAEDLVQDTLMKAYAGLGTFKQETNLRGWLFRIMTNAYINTYRKERRRPVHYSTSPRSCRPLPSISHQLKHRPQNTRHWRSWATTRSGTRCARCLTSFAPPSTTPTSKASVRRR